MVVDVVVAGTGATVIELFSGILVVGLDGAMVVVGMLVALVTGWVVDEISA